MRNTLSTLAVDHEGILSALVRAYTSEFHKRANRTGRDFSYFEHNHEILVKFQGEAQRGRTRIHLGFPFPLECATAKIANPFDCSIDIFLFGQSFRDSQFNSFCKSLEGRINWKDGTTTNSTPSFERHCDILILVDQFQFAGDSTSALRLFDNLRGQIAHNSSVLMTTNKMMDGIFGYKFLELDAIASQIRNLPQTNCIFVIPNFIDSQWEASVQIIRHIIDICCNATILVPGRNFEIIGCSGVWSGTKRPIRDIVIHNMSVEQQFDRACEALGFQPISKSDQPRRISASSRYALINPFANDRRKWLSIKAVKAFIRAWQRLFGNEVQIVISTGGHVSPSEMFHRLDLENNTTRFDVLQPSGLCEVVEAIGAASILFSCDSAPVHIANRLGTPCIANYYSSRWDPFSTVSLFHHSPLGFSPSSPIHIPISMNWIRPSGFAQASDEFSIMECVSAILDGPTSKLRKIAESVSSNSPREFGRSKTKSRSPQHWLDYWWPLMDMEACLTRADLDVGRGLMQLAHSLSPAQKILAL